MENNVVLNGQAAPSRLSPEVYRKLAVKREAEIERGEDAKALNDELYLKRVPAAGVVREAADYHVNVAGFEGKLEEAPALEVDSKPPASTGSLWVEKIEPGAKGTFLIYSPAFFGVWTHYRSPGTVLCFKDRTLCVGGHDEDTRRWHGFLHCFHYEKNKQCILKITPEAAKDLNAQVAEGTTLRGLKITLRRSKAAKGPYYVAVVEIVADHSRLPAHRDPRASIFKLFKIKPTKRMITAALSGGEEDIPTGIE